MVIGTDPSEEDNLHHEIAELENQVLLMKREWEEVYPYAELSLALELIHALGMKLFEETGDEEILKLLLNAREQIAPKMLEPEVFHLL